MPPDRATPERRRSIALAVVLVAFLSSAVAVGVTGCPKRKLAKSLEGGARSSASIPRPPVVVPPPPVVSSPPPPSAPPNTPPTPEPPRPSPPSSSAYKVVEVKDGGTIAGICRISREVTLWDVERLKDNEKGCGATKQPTERIATGPDRALGNCVVFLRSISAGKDFPEDLRPEDRKRLVDQKACRYVPHVSWVRVATQMAVGNSDLAEHNIHGFKDSRLVTQFNFSTKPQSRVDDQEAAFLEKAGVYILKCDIHPWMSGYVHVSPHPYYDITSAEDDPRTGRKAGAYALTDVPPGDYEVVCWHEGMKEDPVVMGGQIKDYNYGTDYVSPPRKVTVETGKTAVADFEVPAP